MVRPSREGDFCYPNCHTIWKVRSACPIHFPRYSARNRVTIMLREIQEGE